jgi:uncharacterized protein (DUF1697 family)
MKTCIALFRGVNIGGKNILPMKNLVVILENIGCKKVKTYIQSGNAVFQTVKNETTKLAEKISSRILESRGFKPKVLLLDISELEEAIENNPFETENGKALHFFFLDTLPKQPDLEQLTSVKSTTEEFKLDKKVFYLYAPDGVGRSKLAAKVEQAIGVPVTARNYNTVNKLMAMAKQL